MQDIFCRIFIAGITKTYGHQLPAITLIKQSHRISAVYLPLFLQPEEIQFPVAMDNHTYFIYSEHPATSFLTRPDIVKLEATQELTFQVSDWLASFRKSMT